MKKSISKGNFQGIIVVTGILILCTIIGIYYAKGEKNTWSSYSINSDAVNGYSAFYQTLKEMNLQVKTGYSPVEQIDRGQCQIIVAANHVDLNAANRWAEQGGILVYIETGISNENDIEVENVGEGIIISAQDADKLNNLSLLDDTQTAYEIYTLLQKYAGHRQIIFNEYYLHNSDTDTMTLWEVMPNTVKMIVLQLGVCIILYLIYAGKRFGKVQDLVEETERKENEYIYSIAGMYEKAGAWDLVFDSYYQALENKLMQLVKEKGDFLEIWEKAELPELDIARSVVSYMQSFDKKRGIKPNKQSKKEMIHILEMIEHLMKIIDKRREQYWKL